MNLFSAIEIRGRGRGRWIVLACWLAAAVSAPADLATNAPGPANARDFYNLGTRLLAAKKYAEAEKMFQSALAAQDDRVQPAALYNVGHARFAAGMDRLKQGPDAQKAVGQAKSALATGDHAIRNSQSALADSDLDRMIAAYLEGRGARRQLRDAEKAVSTALETYGKTLEQWTRADGDFKSAAELNPSDTNAVKNAETVDRAIARLVDSVRKMQDILGMMGKQRQDLGKLMSKMKGQIPAPNSPPGMAGDDDEDDNPGGPKPESLIGMKENAGREGDQMQVTISPDQASQILNGLSLDGTRRLDMSDKEGAPQSGRKGRNW